MPGLPHRRKLTIVAALALSLATLRAIAQADAPPLAQPTVPTSSDVALPVFDVILIKPNKSGDRPSIDFDGGSFSATNLSVKMLILYAYDLEDDQLYGVPKWGDELRFDMRAKVVDGDSKSLRALTNEQKRLIERTILTDRFQLTFHHEMKVLPVYELTVDKGGPKFQGSRIEPGQKGANGMTAGSLHTNNHGGNADMTSTAVQISSLVNVLSRQVERVVLDKTGLTGRYDLNLVWSRDDGGTPAVDLTGPSIFTAIEEQLGLRLRPAKAPVETLVVDHVALPSEN